MGSLCAGKGDAVQPRRGEGRGAALRPSAGQTGGAGGFGEGGGHLSIADRNPIGYRSGGGLEGLAVLPL